MLFAFALRWCAAGRSALSEPVKQYAHMLLITSKVRLLPFTLSILVSSLFRASSTYYPYLNSANFEHLRMPYLPQQIPNLSLILAAAWLSQHTRYRRISNLPIPALLICSSTACHA